MNKIPEVLQEKIILDKILLEKNVKWNKIHKEICLLKTKSIKCVISINNKLFRHNLRYYKVHKNQIKLPMLKHTKEKFYTFSYISRICDNGFKWNDLPYLKCFDINDYIFM